jgi:putative two-component system protein, hydrogenase maturation factor HypX/HoxX
MQILFLTTAHNSLSQRLYIELTELGHSVGVALATSAEAMLQAATAAQPDLILAPMLKKVVPDAVWRTWPCVIVHPGIRGDRGPSSLDWAIALKEKTWGVTNLQAEAEMDAGPIWASHEFPMRARAYSKSTLYREDVTEAAVRGTLETVRRLAEGNFEPEAWAASCARA